MNDLAWAILIVGLAWAGVGYAWICRAYPGDGQ